MHMKRYGARCYCAAVVALAFLAFPASAGELHVPAQFASIGAAAAAALSGDEIIVADGLYSGSENRDIELQGRAIYIRSESGPDQCVIDCELGGRAFILDGGADAEVAIEGFTIRNGQADIGGAVLCVDANLSINNCIFELNSATSVESEVVGGGAVAFSNSRSSIRACTFVGNHSAIGGAIGLSSSTMQVSDSEFQGNGDVVTMSGFGGAIAIVGEGKFGATRLQNCSIHDNFGSEGLALYVSTSTCELTDCRVERNSVPASSNSAILAQSSTLRLRGTRVSNSQPAINGQSISMDILGCEFDDNGSSLELFGAGMTRAVNTIFRRNGDSIAVGFGARALVQNCVFHHVTSGYALICFAQSSIEASNCTATYNPESVGLRDGWFVLNSINTGVAEVSSCVAVGPSPAIVSATATRCITVDHGSAASPRFVKIAGPDDVLGTDDDNLRPIAGSPCVDAGAGIGRILPDFLDLDGDGNTTEATPFDIEGRLRRVDDPLTPDTPGVMAPRYDIGAYELVRPCVLPGDVSADGLVSIVDLSRLLASFGRASGAVVGEGDLNNDGQVGLQDLSILLANFGAECP